MAKAWMPMYWGDYLADTAHFSTAQHGAYLLLIAYYWCNGSLPQDEKQLRRIAKCSPLAWRKISSLVMAKFNDQRRHKRIDIELAKAIEKSKANSTNAMQRWHPSGNAIHNHNHNHIRKKDIDRQKKKGLGDWVVNEEHRVLAQQLGVNVEAEETKFRDYLASHGKRYSDYDATFRNWLKNSQKFNGGNNGAETDRERRKRESREALDKLKAFGEGRGNGDFCAPAVRLLPPTGTGGES